jgi:hypothetical protein
MVILRFVVMIGLIIIGVSLLAAMVTRDRRWFRFAWQVFKFGALLSGAVLLLMVAERLLLPVL